MYINRKEAGPICGRIVEDRRSGLDRRQITYDWYIPERRITADRRFSIPSPASGRGEWRDKRKYA